MRTLTYSLIFAALIATVGLGLLFDRFYEQYNDNETHEHVDSINSLQQLGSEIANTLNNLPDKHRFVEQWGAKTAFKLQLVPAANLILPAELLSTVKHGKPILLETNSDLAIHYYLASSDEFLILKFPLVKIKKPNQLRDYIFTLLFYVALLVSFLLWVYPLVHRLIVIRRVAKAFGEGDLTQRIKLTSTSYVRDIEVEFNAMAQRIQNLVDDVKLLSSAVSHELRTPLARIRFGIDTLQEENDPVVRRRFERKISANVDEMTLLVETLLNYARIDQAMFDIKKDKIDLSQLVDEAIQRKCCAQVEIQWIKPHAAYLVVGDRTYLNMMMNNLLQNAILYGDSKVIVSLSSSQSHAILAIEDNGQGIPVAQRESMLKPFVRGTDVQKGYGIGLAFVKRILDWHQGTVEIDQSAQLSGAKFIITLPVSP